MSPTILCLASYFKGGLFVEECKRQGCHTILVTPQKLEHEAWPRQAIDEFFMLPHANLGAQPDITHAVAYLARERNIDRIIALDDYDVEIAAICVSTCGCQGWVTRWRVSFGTNWPCASRPTAGACRCQLSPPC